MDPRQALSLSRIHGRIAWDHSAQAEFQHCPINAYLIADLAAAYASQESAQADARALRDQLAEQVSVNQQLRLVQYELQDALGDSLAEAQSLRVRNLSLFRDNLRIRRAARSGRVLPLRRLPATFQRFLPEDSTDDSEEELLI